MSDFCGCLAVGQCQTRQEDMGILSEKCCVGINTILRWNHVYSSGYPAAHTDFYSKKSIFSFLEKATPAMYEGWPTLSCQEGHSTLARRELMRDQEGSSDTLTAAVTQDCASQQISCFQHKGSTTGATNHPGIPTSLTV